MSVTGTTTAAAQKQRQGKRLLGCFFIVFMLFGLGFTAIFAWPIVQIVQARNWRQTPCTILTSEVEGHSGSKGGSTYSVAITYEYFVDDQRYVSSRYKFMSGSSSGREGKQEIVDRLGPGTRTVCYVNKRDSTDAVIERGFTADILLGFIPMIFVLIGAGGIYGVFIHKAKPGKKTDSPGLPAPEAAKGRPATLKSSVSPAGRLGCALIFALIWNGIVSIFLVDVVSGWSKGQGDGCSTVFLIPFLLVGIGVLGLAGYYFLALFNPRPTLRVGGGAAALGDTVEVEWDVAGNVDRMKSFTITLEGREEATYRRGTSTSTDKSTFFTLELVRFTRGKDMRRGKVKAPIPADSMHSFKSANNKIVWCFQVKGDIPRWPDVNEEFAFDVLPQRLPPGVAKEGTS